MRLSSNSLPRFHEQFHRERHTSSNNGRTIRDEQCLIITLRYRVFLDGPNGGISAVVVSRGQDLDATAQIRGNGSLRPEHFEVNVRIRISLVHTRCIVLPLRTTHGGPPQANHSLVLLPPI